MKAEGLRNKEKSNGEKHPQTPDSSAKIPAS
jgi:hypothetical protein